MDSSVSLEISTVLNYTYKVNFEYRLKIWYRLISKNSGIEPVIYRSVSKNAGIEPVIYRSVSKNSYIYKLLYIYYSGYSHGVDCRCLKNMFRNLTSVSSPKAISTSGLLIASSAKQLNASTMPSVCSLDSSVM